MQRQFLSFKTKSKQLHEAIGNALSSIMDQDLQTKFSGCEKLNKGVGKQNFSNTHLYKELNGNRNVFIFKSSIYICIFVDFLMKQFEGETESSILTKISRWFSGSKDRFGGRSRRKST